MWVTYWRKTCRTEAEQHAISVWPAVLILTATTLGLAAASGTFGLAMQIVGVVLLIPLLPAASVLLVGAPAMIFMCCGTAVATAVQRIRGKE